MLILQKSMWSNYEFFFCFFSQKCGGTIIPNFRRTASSYQIKSATDYKSFKICTLHSQRLHIEFQNLQRYKTSSSIDFKIAFKKLINEYCEKGAEESLLFVL